MNPIIKIIFSPIAFVIGVLVSFTCWVLMAVCIVLTKIKRIFNMRPGRLPGVYIKPDESDSVNNNH